MTNREAAQTDSNFLKACELAGQLPSRSQYRKFKVRRGKVHEVWKAYLDNGGAKGINAR